MYHLFARSNATLTLLVPILFVACDSGSLGVGRTATESPPAAAPMAAPPPAPAPMVAPPPTPSLPPSPPMVVPPPDPPVVGPTPPVPPPPPMPPPVVSEMPPAVYALLQQKCASCHTYGQGDRAGWGSVLATSQMIAADVIVPGNT